MRSQWLTSVALAGFIMLATGGAASVSAAQDGVVDKTTHTTKKVVKKTGKAAEKTGETVTDGFITTELHAKFVDEKTLKGSKIDVDTDKHVVTLNGTVMSEAGKARAAQIARTTKGVDRVINNLVVGPKK
jgi:hyperosmotically inducible periplasmic protein